MSRSAAVFVVDGGGAPENASPRPVTEVAVGILIDREGRYLLTSRPAGKAYAGYWEFPGGKLEAGESVEQALRRELQEEIGVTIGEAPVWRDSMVDYPHALVHLQFCKVTTWSGDLHMHEGQSYCWQRLPVSCEPVLPGTVPVLAWLAEEALAGDSQR
ncbi:NUDIX domain-containing protein [Hydrogenophaga sp. RWCD_12]|uniref:NUDIX domain-containing protein n=1 Tax=Hydrogenophaga sp. RWCD_12 TaxID=3391190 RepID=UPI00398505C0